MAQGQEEALEAHLRGASVVLVLCDTAHPVLTSQALLQYVTKQDAAITLAMIEEASQQVRQNASAPA